MGRGTDVTRSYVSDFAKSGNDTVTDSPHPASDGTVTAERNYDTSYYSRPYLKVAFDRVKSGGVVHVTTDHSCDISHRNGHGTSIVRR